MLRTPGQILPAVLFNDPTDAVIPFTDSEALADFTGAALRAMVAATAPRG